MTILLFFILGIITIRYIFPLLDQILSLILQAIEVKKGKLLIQQTQCEKEISDITIQIEQPPTNQIGFVLPDEDVEYEEEEDV